MNRLLLFLIVAFSCLVHAQKIDISFLKDINKNEQDTYKVWIFLTDKGRTDQNSFSKASALISEKAINRRLKVNSGKLIDTYDLPLNEKYLENLSRYVLILKKSRWLNAVSCIAKGSDIPLISALTFVKKIRRVGYAPKEDLQFSLVPAQKTGKFFKTTDLDYGPSIIQLEVSNIPNLHKYGFSGEGVTIAMLDNGFNLYKTHVVFNSIKIGDTYDFIHNDTSVDDTNSVWADNRPQGFHGTTTLSVIGGYMPGQLIGPAYNATYLLYRTEMDSVEIQREEDNWVAGLERAEAMGADVVNSSLGYIDWYTPEDLDGKTAVTTLAASIAELKGLIVVNSAGNEGNISNSLNTLVAPADGKYVITAGAVYSNGEITYFSSHGPTADGRIKPDVVAMGSSVIVASYTNNNQFISSQGTSYSSPLVAGSVALLVEAFPWATPAKIREKIRETASRSANPDNQYGWGILDLTKAYNRLKADTLSDPDPLEIVNFPNPFNEQTHIHINYDGVVELTIYDIMGREVAYFPKRFITSSEFINISKDQLNASGIYFYILKMENEETGLKIVDKGKLILVK